MKLYHSFVNKLSIDIISEFYGKNVVLSNMTILKQPWHSCDILLIKNINLVRIKIWALLNPRLTLQSLIGWQVQNMRVKCLRNCFQIWAPDLIFVKKDYATAVLRQLITPNRWNALDFYTLLFFQHLYRICT